MALLKKLSTFALAAGLAAPIAGFGDDIDLFKGGSSITGQTPNVLVIVDNTVNWNNNANHWPGGKQAQEELESLSEVVSTLTGDVSIGVMMINNSAGYLRFGLRPMNVTNRTALQNILTGMAANTGSNDVPTSQGDYGALMYEAWKYFSGSNAASISSSQRDYAGNGSYNISTYLAGNVAGNPLSSSTSTQYVQPLSSTTPCNKNFIIFIGNGFPSTSSTNPSSLSVTGWTSADSTQIYAEGSKTTYLDEWARFLYKTGIKNVPCDTSVTPNICADGLVTTYTIDVFKDHADPDQTALLKSAASVGGGKYFQATSKADIKTAIAKIIAEVQAVNSVFTSASLPVSVNTQGTYLNQIYMGVFRPDSQGAPRWMGNLKQYKFGVTTDSSGNDTIFLADADGTAAVNATSGFVNPTARSYWSTSTTPSAGFWAYNPTGQGGQYDAPDGDLVEKGGAAQRLRTMGPTARTIYTCTSADCATSGTTPSLFTTTNTNLIAALSGTSSSATAISRVGPTVTVTTASDLSLSSPTDTVSISGASVSAYNSTVTATKLSSTQFTFQTAETPATPATGTITVSSGTSVAQGVTSGSAMTYSNGTVTVNLPAHGFINNQSVTIAGAAISASMATATNKCTSRALATPTDVTCEYNGTYNITYIDANNFSFTPPIGNFGTNTTVTGTNTTLDPPDVISLPSSPTPTAAITCRNNTGANGSVTISSITRVSGSGSKQVKVTLASLPTSCTSTLTTAGTGNNGRIETISLSNTGQTTLNIAPTITGVGTACGATAASSSDRIVCFNVTVNSTSTDTTTTTSIIPATPATGTITATGIPTRQVTSITRTAGNASNVATVTVTTAVNHGFGAATSVTISGADQTEYNGTKTTANTVGNQLVINSGTNTLTYTLTTGPTTPATGGTVARGSTVDAPTLISWVRGVDNKDDENVNASLTDCRASIHGDVLHSRPLVVNYGGSTGIYAFYGSNDGTFRAVKAGQDESGTSNDGKEAWSFVASEHYNTLSRLYNNTPLIKYLGTTAPRTARDYFFDGNIGVFQSANLATTHIFISMRRGGRFIYALDVSTPTAPKFLWKKSYTDTGMSELGYTWSEPKVIPIKKTSGVACNTTHSGLSSDSGSSYIRALVFGAGYDPSSEDTDQTASTAPRRPNATMGRGVFVLNAADGSLIKLLQPPADDYKGNTNSARRYPIPSDVTVLDSDGDGCVDRIYVGDTGAKMHRFDIGDASSANWKAYTIGTFGDIGDNGTNNDRKFMFAPEVVLGIVSGKQVAYVMAGTGDREQPSQTSIDNNFYMIRDTIVAGDAVASSSATTNAVDDTQMKEVTNFNKATSTINSAVVNSVSCLKTSNDSSTCFHGWYIPYETGEKSVNAALAVAGSTFFGTNKPKAVDPRSCEPNLGIARGYAINFLSGTSAVGDRDGSGTINRSDLYSTFKGGGLPPSPVSGVVQISSSKTVRFVIGSGGTGTTGSTIEGVKTQVNPSGTRTRVFWYFKKDD